MTEGSESAFNGEWLDGLVARTADRSGLADMNGVVGLNLGKTSQMIIAINGGRVVGLSTETPEVVLRFSAEQISAYLAGTLELANAYMKGDLKPEGSIGALVAALEVLDWANRD